MYCKIGWFSFQQKTVYRQSILLEWYTNLSIEKLSSNNIIKNKIK